MRCRADICLCMLIVITRDLSLHTAPPPLFLGGLAGIAKHVFLMRPVSDVSSWELLVGQKQKENKSLCLSAIIAGAS